MRFLLIACCLFACGCETSHKSLVESTGTIEALQIDVRSEIGGKILKLHVDEGDRVQRDDVLVEIDHEKLDLDLLQARGSAKELHARYALFQHGYRAEEIEKAGEALQDAEIQMKNAKRDNERIQQLYRDGVVSISTRDSSETLYQSLLKRLARARKDYEIAQDGFRPEEIAAAQGAADRSDAAVKRIMRNILDATVSSPASGVISEKYVEQGEVVSPGSLLLTVTDLRDTWIMAYVSEKNLGNIKLGQSARVYVDSYPGRPFPGKITYISTEAEFTPKNIQTKEERVKLVFGVKVRISNDEEILKPGMPADVTVIAQEVPADAARYPDK